LFSAKKLALSIAATICLLGNLCIILCCGNVVRPFFSPVLAAVLLPQRLR